MFARGFGESGSQDLPGCSWSQGLCSQICLGPRAVQLDGAKVPGPLERGSGGDGTCSHPAPGGGTEVRLPEPGLGVAGDPHAWRRTRDLGFPHCLGRVQEPGRERGQSKSCLFWHRTRR